MVLVLTSSPLALVAVSFARKVAAKLVPRLLRARRKTKITNLTMPDVSKEQ